MFRQESDRLIVARKSVKKNMMERRGRQIVCAIVQEHSDPRGIERMESQVQKIRFLSATHPKVEGLMHQVNEASLLEAHKKQKGNKAVGVDGVSKEEYGRNLMENIDKLVESMKKFQYRPKPVRRVYIPKGDGRLRPLGIPSYEDKLVQYTMAKLLEAVYEPRFLDCSYGFRPKRRAHDVIRYIDWAVMRKNVNWVLEADIKGFFDNVDQKQLVEFLEHDIADKNFIRYIVRIFKGGIMEEGKYFDSDKGTPQGGLVSPILANVYLHYVLDTWIMEMVKPRMKGEMYYVRYADDFLVLFEYESDAQKVYEALEKRLAKFKLELAKDKTRILPIGRNGGGKGEFDFLGFTCYDTLTRGGRYRLGVRSSSKKLKAKRKNVKAWIVKNLRKPVHILMKKVDAKLRGHYNYYGVNGNFSCIRKFEGYVRNMLYKFLNRRSQRRSLSFEKFIAIWAENIAKPRIMVQIWN